MAQLLQSTGTLDRHKLLKPVYVATALTLFAEAVYFVIWGVVLFPEGSLVGKLIWTLTCGVGMGVVIGIATILLVGEKRNPTISIITAAATMAIIGSNCGILCSLIDERFDYFGGPENTTLFIVGSVFLAIVGGALYGWLVYAPSRNRVYVRSASRGFANTEQEV
ncbi:MAG: hypothetical protein O2967_06355 [Proteobacteria bacterium]|nr:hypothetical protein [Pseudomonadota bacterium]